MKNGENIIPEAGNLYSALRNSGYSNIAAIGDLIDNSLDAGASVIKVVIADDLKQIILADNGCGMSLEELRQALRLGGRKAHNDAADLGKYGLGLITASISMGTRLRIITKKDGITSVGIFDVKEVYDSNKFVASFRVANDSEIQNLNSRIDDSNSGTVLFIDNCDKIQYNNLGSFIEALKEYVETAFWAFLNDGRKIIIDDIEAVSKDPLYGFDSRTEVRFNKIIDVPMSNGKAEKLEILAVLIPEFDKKLNRDLHINIETQGFYVLRNNREIAPAVEILDVFKKHNDFNRLRIKLNFGPGLDEEMGVNYTKHNISPNKRMISILKHELGDEVVAIRRKIKEAQKAKKKQKEDATEPNKDGQSSSDNTGIATETVTTNNNIKVDDVKIRCGDEKDGLLDYVVSGDKASVWYNCESKYYKKNFIDKEDGLKLKSGYDVIIKALLESLINNNVQNDTIGQIVKDVSSALEKSEF